MDEKTALELVHQYEQGVMSLDPGVAFAYRKLAKLAKARTSEGEMLAKKAVDAMTMLALRGRVSLLDVGEAYICLGINSVEVSDRIRSLSVGHYIYDTELRGVNYLMPENHLVLARAKVYLASLLKDDENMLDAAAHYLCGGIELLERISPDDNGTLTERIRQFTGVDAQASKLLVIAYKNMATLAQKLYGDEGLAYVFMQDALYRSEHVIDAGKSGETITVAHEEILACLGA